MMSRRYRRKIEEKTLEINICENLINLIRSCNSLFKKAYWRGLTLRLEHRIGLDVKIEPGMYKALMILGIQFKKPKNKEYDFKRREYYYLFEINNNPANNQHLILYFLSSLIHYKYPQKNCFIGYSFPLFINHDELRRYSPMFLNRTIFIDARYFPETKLDRLTHKIYIYENIYDVEIESKKRIKIEKEYILTKEKLIEKFKGLEKENLVNIRNLQIIGPRDIEILLEELKGKVSTEIIKYLKEKIERGFKTEIKRTILAEV